MRELAPDALRIWRWRLQRTAPAVSGKGPGAAKESCGPATGLEKQPPDGYGARARKKPENRSKAILRLDQRLKSEACACGRLEAVHHVMQRST